MQKENEILSSIESAFIKKGHSLDKIVNDFVGSSDLPLKPTAEPEKLEKVKALYLNGRQPLDIAEIQKYEKAVRRFWSLSQKNLKSKSPLERARVRFVYRAMKAIVALEKACSTNESNDFRAAALSAVQMLGVLAESAAIAVVAFAYRKKLAAVQRGKDSMKKITESKESRNERILSAYKQIASDGGRRDAASILAKRFSMTAEQIRRIIKKTDTG